LCIFCRKKGARRRFFGDFGRNSRKIRPKSWVFSYIYLPIIFFFSFLLCFFYMKTCFFFFFFFFQLDAYLNFSGLFRGHFRSFFDWNRFKIVRKSHFSRQKRKKNQPKPPKTAAIPIGLGRRSFGGFDGNLEKIVRETDRKIRKTCVLGCEIGRKWPKIDRKTGFFEPENVFFVPENGFFVPENGFFWPEKWVFSSLEMVFFWFFDHFFWIFFKKILPFLRFYSKKHNKKKQGKRGKFYARQIFRFCVEKNRNRRWESFVFFRFFFVFFVSIFWDKKNSL
jgi:hypothetical protein